MKSVLILAGASAAGKTTLAMKLLENDGKFSYVRSATTRKKRGDAHDSEYVYIDRGEFERRIADGEMLEYMEYGGNLYGTPKSEIERIFSENKTPLLILDITGVRSMRSLKLDYSVVAFYVYEDINVIEKRLYERELGKSPSASGVENFQKRRLNNVRDYKSLPENHVYFNAFIKNSDVNTATERIQQLFSEMSRVISFLPENADVAKILADSVKDK